MESHTSTQNLNFRFYPLCLRSRQPPECWTASPSKFFKTPLKNLPQCVVKFNHETLLGCFLTFLFFLVLTTCSWSLAHLVGLFDDILLIIWSDNTFSIFDPSGQTFDSFNTFLMVVVLLWSLVCLLIFLLAEKLPQCDITRSMVRPMDKLKVCHTFSPIRVSFLSSKPFSHCYLEFLIPELQYFHRFGRFCKRCPFA